MENTLPSKTMYKRTSESVPMAEFMELKKRKELLDIFFYAAAHDLRRPIGNIYLLSELLMLKSTNEDMELAQNLKYEIKGLDEILTGLTDMIKVAHTDNRGAKDVFFTEVAAKAKREFGKALQVIDGSLQVYLEDETVRYIEPFITSIVSNLVSNAIKYRSMDRKLEIRLTTRKLDGFFILTVVDNGIGIDLENNGKQLFMPFKRFTNTVEGTGLGLYLIAMMIEKNGGRIDVLSTPGQGSSFICYLKEY